MTPGAVWELQFTAGATTNGGCFDIANKGATGVDYSMQSGAQATGTVTSVTTTVTATGAIFDNTMLGNCITDGTTFVIITGFTSSTIVTVDTAPSWTAASIKVGGAQKTIDTIFNKIVAGNTVWMKNNGGDSITAARTLTAGTITAPIFIRGYSTTRGDIDNGTVAATHLATGFLDTTNFPVLACAANVLTVGDYSYLQGLKITSTVAGNATSFTGSNVGGVFRCAVSNTSTNSAATAVTSNSLNFLLINDCDLSTAGASGGFVASNGSSSLEINASRVTSTSGGGVRATINLIATNSVFYSMAASQTACLVNAASRPFIIVGCTFDSILGTCASVPNSAQTLVPCFFSSNIVSNCGTGCNNLRSGTTRVPIFGSNNQFWSTTTPYTGWANVTDTTGYLPGDIQTGNNSNYVAQGSQNFRPSSSSNGINQGLPLGTTIGAFQLSSTGGGYQGSEDGVM